MNEYGRINRALDNADTELCSAINELKEMDKYDGDTVEYMVDALKRRLEIIENLVKEKKGDA